MKDCKYTGSRVYSAIKLRCKCDACTSARKEYRKTTPAGQRERDRHRERMRERRSNGENV